MSDEQLHARDRVVQQMSRQGLVEENLTQNTVKNISSRQENFVIGDSGAPDAAHERSQNRMYYQTQPTIFTPDDTDNHRLSSELPQPLSQPISAQPTVQITQPEYPADADNGMEEFGFDAEIPAAKEFAGLLKQTVIPAGSGVHGMTESLQEEITDKAERLLEYKGRKLKNKIKKEQQRAQRLLSREEDENEEEEEESEDGENTDNETDKKSVKPDMAKEDGVNPLKFEYTENPDEKKLSGKKKRKGGRLKFDDTKGAESEYGESGKYAISHISADEESEREASGRLHFEDDLELDTHISPIRRLAAAGVRKKLRELEDEEEEELDFGVRNAYQAGKSVAEGAGFIYGKRKLLHLQKENEQLEREVWQRSRLKEKSERASDSEERSNHQERMKERSGSLKEGSRYRKEPEKKNLKKEYQKRINQQKSQEIQSQIRKNNEFIGKTKKTAAKTAAAAKKSIIAVIGVILLFVIAFFVIGAILIYLFYMAEAGLGAMYSGLYQSTYSDISDCEAYFRELETDLEEEIAGIEEDEVYEECYEFIYDLGNIGHNAVELISYLAVKYEDFTLAMCKEELDGLFEEMYTLTIEVKEEPREREKKDVEGNVIYDENGEAVKEEFAAKICYVTLSVKPWADMMRERLTEKELGRYRVYLMSRGGQQVYTNPLADNWKDKISSPFGYRIHPITKEKTLHAGIDIAVPVGTPLHSCTNGIVTTAHYSETAGNFIIVQMDSGYSIKYMHLDSLGVSAGDTVEKGMLIGTTGNTGRSTGPHLHLEVRTPDDKPIDPTFIISNGVKIIEEEQQED